MWFNKKSQAVISVFLILILLPVWGLAVILVDGARVQSAKMMVQEAGDLAALSTLSKYNTDLKDDFGLFALADSSKANEVFEAYLKSSLSASLGGDNAYSDQVYNAVKNAIFSGDSGITNFTDLYRFTLGKPSVTPHFQLDQKEVLQNQIVEFTKYRGAHFLADRLSILANLGEISKQFEDTKKSGELMDEKMEIDEDGEKDIEEKIGKLNEQLENLHIALDNYNNYKTQVVYAASHAVTSIENEYDKYVNNKDDEETYPSDLSVVRNANISELKDAAKEADKLADKAYDKFKAIKKNDIAQIIENIDATITKLSDFKKNKVDTSTASVKKEMQTDIEESIEKYKQYKTRLEKLQLYFGTKEGQPSLEYTEDLNTLKLATTMCTNIYNAIKKSRDDEMNSPGILNLENDLDTDSHTKTLWYYGMKVTDNGTKYVYDVDHMCNEQQARITYYDGESAGCNYYISQCFDIKNRTILEEHKDIKDNCSKYLKTEDDSVDDRKTAEKAAKDANNSESNYEGKKIPSAEYSILPSKGTPTNDEGKKPKYETKAKKLTKDTHNILGSMDVFAGLKDMAEGIRDEALTFAYIFGMFDTRLTHQNINSYEKPSSWQNYHVQWRYENPDGEHDLMERPKNSEELSNVINCEVEYIFAGNQSDTANCASVYAWIYGTRVANNLVAVYANKSAREKCYNMAVATAAAVSAATLGTVTLSPKVYQWIYITAWALAETTIEMNFLVNNGYKVSLIKTGQNLIMESITDAVNLEGKLHAKLENEALAVSYEDYLLLMLLLGTNSETRVRRIGDVVQLNMRNRHDKNFLLNKASTYIEATTDVQMPFLFQSINQFSSFYEGHGTGINVKSTIFQGY